MNCETKKVVMRSRFWLKSKMKNAAGLSLHVCTQGMHRCCNGRWSDHILFFAHSYLMINGCHLFPLKSLTMRKGSDSQQPACFTVVPPKRRLLSEMVPLSVGSCSLSVPGRVLQARGAAGGTWGSGSEPGRAREVCPSCRTWS